MLKIITLLNKLKAMKKIKQISTLTLTFVFIFQNFFHFQKFSRIHERKFFLLLFYWGVFDGGVVYYENVCENKKIFGEEQNFFLPAQKKIFILI